MRRAVVVASMLAGALAFAPTAAHAGKSCKEVSDTVGEQVCTRFGRTWSVEGKLALSFRFGMRYGVMGTDGLSFKEGFKSRDRPEGYVGYRYSGDALGTSSLSGLGTDGGFTFIVYGQLYTGIDGGIALGSAQTRTFTTGSHTLSDAGGVDVLILHGGAPVGYRIPLGRASIRGEVLFGATIANVSQYSEQQDAERRRAGASAMRGLIETRIAADIWFTQHISFGAYFGQNLLDSRGRAMGLTLAWHVRAFDGDMSLW